MHAASVNSEPGSNSPLNGLDVFPAVLSAGTSVCSQMEELNLSIILYIEFESSSLSAPHAYSTQPHRTPLTLDRRDHPNRGGWFDPCIYLTKCSVAECPFARKNNFQRAKFPIRSPAIQQPEAEHETYVAQKLPFL